MKWYLHVIQKKYLEFNGRAHREEFWMFTLINFLVSLALGVVGGLVGFDSLQGLYGLAVLLPSIAVAIRRLHDTSRSGWWFLLVLLPVIGWIILIVFYAQDSHAGDNAYGANPKTAPAAA